MSPCTAPTPLVSPATIASEADHKTEALVRKMMLSPPSAMPAALLDIDHIVRGDGPLLNIAQLKTMPVWSPMDSKQATNTKTKKRRR